MATVANNSLESLQPTVLLRVRVFLASPGDVAEERGLARAVIDRLRHEFRYKDRIKFETVAWDQPYAAVSQEATLTPQAAIAKGLPKPSECDVVIVVFWSRMGTPLPAESTKPDGSPYLSGTEWEFWNAVDSARERRYPTVWLYRRTQIPNPSFDDPQYEEIKKQWHRVEVFFNSFSDDDGTILGSINEYETPEAFKAKLEDHLRGWLERRLAAFELEHPAIPTPRDSPVRWEGTPYPGLRAFTPDEAPIFFGRRREINALIRMLSTPELRFVAVVGASGSGKSSLVAAGLLPALKDNAIDGSDHWLFVRFKPAEVGDNPYMALAAQLTPLLERHGWRAREIAAQLYEMPTLLTERLIEQVREACRGVSDLLLVIDQFEELFTICDSEYLGQFIDLVATAANAPYVRVVITMRADYYRNCLDWPELTTLLDKGSYSLPAPGIAALLGMIQEPARLAGLSIEEGLADRMLQDIGQTPGRLALLAFALGKLYEAGKAQRRLTHDAYQYFGGVRGAIAQMAEATYSDLQMEDVAVEAALGRVFRELVIIDPDRNVATRKRAQLSRFSGDALRLVNALIHARLVVCDRGLVEVAHEFLFESWPRLAAWLQTARDDLRLHWLVETEARVWANAGRDVNHLWSHERLAAVYGMLSRLGITMLDEPLKSFVRPEAERLLDKVKRSETNHYRRAAIGDRLNQIGDPRLGIGVDEADVPQIEWMAIPPGRVSLEDNAGTQDIAPFYIAKYPVTHRQYRAFLDTADGYSNMRWWEYLEHDQVHGEQYRPLGNHPADNVSWYDAVAFCRWLTSRVGYEIRLPTEHEWQHAATGGDPKNVFPWGSEWDGYLANTNESRLSRTTAVGMYPLGETAAGVKDMVGNVWEWCLNKYKKPDDISISGEDVRVLRGGSWFSDPDSARASFRDCGDPDLREFNVGFRLCCLSPNGDAGN